MTDATRAEALRSSCSHQRPSELLRTYAHDPQSPQPDEIQRLIAELDYRQGELEVQNQKLQEAQRQLEAYRDRYVDLYDFAPLGYVTLDEDGYVQEINLAGAKLLGGEVAELVGYPLTDYVVPADRANFLEHIQSCCGEYQDVTSEFGLIAKDGRLVAAQLRSVPIKAIEHEGTFCKTAITDITDRKRAEDAIQEERNLLRTLIDNLPDPIYIKDTQSRFVLANLATAQIMGAASPGDLLGKTDGDFYSQHVAAEYRSDELGLLRSGEAVLNKDEPHVDPQGNPRSVLTTKVPIKDSRGTVVGLVGISRDITARKQTEETLRASEEQLRMVMEASGTGWWDWDLRADALSLDDRCKSLLGMSLTAGASYEGIRQRLRLEDRPRLDQTFASILAEEGEHEIEFAVDWPDGCVRWVLLRGRVFHDAAGVPLRMMGVAGDVTDRRRAQEALRESERFYRTLIETLPVTVVLADAKGQVRYLSPAAKEMFGLSPGEGLGTLPTDWIAPEYHELVRQRMRQVLVDLHPQPPIEYKMLRRDGTLVWAQVASAPVLDRERCLKGVVTVCQDITALKQAEEALRENQERLRLALESAELGWWSWDFTAGSIEGDNKTKSLVGLADTTVPFQAILQRAHPDDRCWLQERVSELQSRAGNYEVEFRVVWPDGSVHWVSARGRSLANPEGQPIRAVGIAMDITARKLAEEELAASKASAEQANRAKDHFLAVLSHELRTPLTPVVMGVSMLQNRPDLDADLRETLEMIRRNTEMEARLIDDLLDVTRISHGKVELALSAVELCTVIQRAVEVCKPDIDARRLHFGVDWGSSAPYWIEADVPRLQQVFWNLLRNAIKFTPAGWDACGDRGER